jgi:hypothetical protein
MRLVQILLPLLTSGGRTGFETVLNELTTEFGGATAILNSPARGLWDDNGESEQDRVVTIEVMVQDFDADWWAGYRKRFEAEFEQKEVVVRAIEIIKV